MRIRDRVTVIRSAAGVLVHNMDEVAFAKVVQEAFRIAPATGNGAGAIRVHVDGDMLHRSDGSARVSAVELKISRITGASRIWGLATAFLIIFT